MDNFLSRIVEYVREKRSTGKEKFSFPDFFSKLPDLPPLHPQSILDKAWKDFFLIAECKQASPSKGILVEDYDPVEIARAYEAGKASAISVLTEEKFFLGSPEHLKSVRQAVEIPVLWKDFILYQEQIAKARLWGADMILLIFRILSRDTLYYLIDLSLQCGLLPLVELFIGDDPQRILEMGERYRGQYLIGINNRDLSTFHTDIEHSKKLYQQLSPMHHHFPFISESGIVNSSDIQRIKEIGFRGALVGESLVKEKNPETAVKNLLL